MATDMPAMVRLPVPTATLWYPEALLLPPTAMLLFPLARAYSPMAVAAPAVAWLSWPSAVLAVSVALLLWPMAVLELPEASLSWPQARASLPGAVAPLPDSPAPSRSQTSPANALPVASRQASRAVANARWRRGRGVVWMGFMSCSGKWAGGGVARHPRLAATGTAAGGRADATFLAITGKATAHPSLHAARWSGSLRNRKKTDVAICIATSAAGPPMGLDRTWNRRQKPMPTPSVV